MPLSQSALPRGWREEYRPRHFPMRDEPVHGPLSAAELLESLMAEHHELTTLRAFTIRILRQVPDGTFASLFAIAKRHGWRAFMGNPETDEFDTLVFINETTS